ncbi:outer membrane protein [Croceicoccus bisphenolivorans]|uniref:outer membrane protein n=1 Tax=Croceicoccus bisphenolivorans TaxID=1783232 RepID=UPI0008314F2D|nr:outer membrane beta-barrel protein [Croceicoccus bisphenolivorans]
MKKIMLSGAAIAAAMAVATSAHANDFDGAYIGAGVTLDNVQGSGDFEGFGVSGPGATIFAGFDMPLGGAFIGVEANADVYTADVAGIDAQWGWGVGARLGTKLNDSTGLYARGGYARGKVEGFWGDGLRYGVGVETGVSDSLSLRAEFSQFNYEDDIINNQGSLGLVLGF